MNPQALIDTISRHYGLSPEYVRNMIPALTVRTDGATAPATSNPSKDEKAKQELARWGHIIPQLRTELNSKKWIAFDLDNTLDDFTMASGKAERTCLNAIVQRKPGLTMEAVASEWAKVLYGTRYHGTNCDGRADRHRCCDITRARFAALLERTGLKGQMYVGELVYIFEDVLDSTRRNSGVRELLATLRRQGKNILVFTTRSQGWRDRAINMLGFRSDIDKFVEVNRVEMACVRKEALAKTLERLGISSTDIAIIGDNEAQDVIKAAMSAAILCFRFGLGDDDALDLAPMRVNSMWKLEHIVKQPTKLTYIHPIILDNHTE